MNAEIVDIKIENQIAYKGNFIYKSLGQLLDGFMHGEGRCEFPNGSIYTGEYKFGRFEGKGKF